MIHSLCLLLGMAPLVSYGADVAWPPWLRTGRLMNIGLNYSSTAPERLDAFVGMGCRIMLGGVVYVPGWGWPSDAAVRAYQAHGLDCIAYTTPHTIYGDHYFEGSDPREVVPRSRDWLAVGAGERRLRPWGNEGERYLVCVNNPGWRAHTKEAIAAIVRTGAIGVFFDDAFPFACYCRHCQARMRGWLARRFSADEQAAMGVTPDTLPPPPAVRLLDMADCKTSLDREWVLFAEHRLEDYILDLKRTARALNPHFLFAVNSSQPGVISCMILSQHVMDLWVYEEGPGSLAPQHNNTLRYLQGFARAQRKPVQMIACGKGWGQEEATPVQYAASIAEAVACGGEFVVHLGHAGQDDEVWRTNPANAETIARYRAFYNQRQALLEGLKPAARVAVYDSNRSALYDSQYFWRLSDLARILNRSGLPYAVVNAEATPELLNAFDAVVVSFAQALTDAEVAALTRYRGAGGTLITVGPVGTVTERWEHRPSPLGAPTFAELPGGEVIPEALAAAAAKGPRLSAPAGSSLQLHAWEKEGDDGRVLVLHVLNRTMAEDGACLRPISGATIHLPPGMVVSAARWETPEGDILELPLEENGTLKLPELHVAALVTIRCA